MGQDKRRQEESPMEQRRNQIVELVNRKGSISFAQLKEAFPSVSEMTLRADLKALDEARRVCGCMAVSSRWSRWWAPTTC